MATDSMLRALRVGVLALLVWPLGCATPSSTSKSQDRSAANGATEPAAQSSPASSQSASAPASTSEAQAATAQKERAVTSARSATQPAAANGLPPTTRPAFAGERYRPPEGTSLTAPKTMEPRDGWERWVANRGADFRLLDAALDARTRPPEFLRVPPPQRPASVQIAKDLPLLDDEAPFAEPPGLASKPVAIHVGVARSTFRTREPEEVLAAAAPFVDLAQREVNVHGAPLICDGAEQVYFTLQDEKAQLMIGHVFEYLVVASWFAQTPEDRAVLLSVGQPARVRDTSAGEGINGTSILLIVPADSKLENFADLKGKRLALAANYVHAPGTFLTHLLHEAGQPPAEAYFGQVTLRRFSKDAVIDVLKGRADVACVDEGTLAMIEAFYGLNGRLRVMAESPPYNVDLVYTSTNNVHDYRTEIELTQRQLNTLGKNPEGQEVLSLFDMAKFAYYRDGDLEVPRSHFDEYLKFINETPIDLKSLLDPAAPVDRRTYDVQGNE